MKKRAIILFNKDKNVEEATTIDEILIEDEFDVDFGGHLKILLRRTKEDGYEIANAMNGWGNNCMDEIAGWTVMII